MNEKNNPDGVVIEGTLTDDRDAMVIAKKHLQKAKKTHELSRDKYLTALTLKREKITSLHNKNEFLCGPIVDACILYLGANIHSISKLQNFNRILQQSRDQYIALLMHKIVPELDHEELHCGIVLARIVGGNIEVIEDRIAIHNHVMSHSKNILEDIGKIFLPTTKYYVNFLNPTTQTGKIGSYSEDDIDAYGNSDGPLFNISDKLKSYFGFISDEFAPVLAIGDKNKIILNLTEALGKLILKYPEAEIKGDMKLPDSVFVGIS
jgi:hypothetical protein